VDRAGRFVTGQTVSQKAFITSLLTCAMKIEANDKVGILMQLQKTASDQMSVIKQDEMVWLNRFLIFYGAVIAWLVTRFLAPSSPGGQIATDANAEAQLIRYSVWFSSFATAAFCFLFTSTRHSYYGVADRLHRIQECLHLYDPNQWEGQSFFPREHRFIAVESVSDWFERTKPMSSFLTRMLFIFGSNYAIDLIAVIALQRMGKGGSVDSWWFWFGANIIILMATFGCDYYRFFNRDESTKGLNKREKQPARSICKQ
jgi:hypothetical protein